MGDSTKEPINLLRGWPSKSLLTNELLRQAANEALSDTSIAHPGLLYGPDEGYPPAREAVAKWLTSFHRPSSGDISAERICITGGASQNLGVMLGVYSDPEYTRNIWLVTPAYMLAFRIFEDAGFSGKMRAVPEDEEGIDIEYLRRQIRKSEESAQSSGNVSPRYKPDRARAKVFKHIIYVVPNFSNPSSRTMSLQRRRELVRLAREYDALITCDDVYDCLQWPVPTKSAAAETKTETLRLAHLPRIVDVDRELDGGAEREGADGFGNVHSNGTWSKILGPGLRSGWAEAAPKLVYGLSQAPSTWLIQINDSGVQRSGGSPSHLTSTYITILLQKGQIQQHIQSVLCPAYANRYSIIMAAVEEYLQPLGFTAPQPDRDVVGGYFIWLGLPSSLRGIVLATQCQEEEKLIIAPGRIFEVPDDNVVQCEQNIRLCFSWEDEPKLAEGVKRIARVAKKLLDAAQGDSGDYVVVEKDTASMLQTFR